LEILKVENIHKAYANHVALNDVSISIPKGSIFGLLGPNGAGKTTLIRIITQILKADSGNVWVEGEALHPKHIEVIGYLPEERGLYKKMKVGEQLLYLAQLKGLTKPEATKRIKAWFEKFEMNEWVQKNIEDLSKGMQQKVQFVATVLHEPKLIILDEPFSGFDPINANVIRDEILSLREKGASIIFSTHRMESVEELCDHIALINKSTKILDGAKNDIKNSFRSGTFMVEHKGQLNLNDDSELMEQNTLEEDYYRSTIKIPTGKVSNDLLQKIIPQVEIRSFVEKIPTINEIFIQKVKEAGHE
jgi:ABC-2 type transport system ATP-binding protein